MKCFYHFKDKSRNRAQKSAPVFHNQPQISDPSATRVAKSESSATTTVPRTIPEIYKERAQNLRVFTFAELRQATSNFSRLLKIGEGGFGCVYKATVKPVDGIGDPLVVAIKKLNRDGNQGHKQWVTEVQFLAVAEHPNLVKLIGYCAVDGERGIQRLLVYEYMPNKSLEHHLFNGGLPELSWDRRMQIVLGSAQGLAYLHEELEIQVIYRDFKSSNILLDEEFRAKLSDFGLAREGPSAGHTHVSTAVVGTQGYAAPDYIQTGHLNSKSDVWSFGVVLYEILTGRKSLERNRPKSEQNLLDWVKQYPSDGRKFSKIMDPRLGNQYSSIAARRIAKLADCCLVKSAKDRPKMSQVVESLKEIFQDSRVESGRYIKDEEEDNDDDVVEAEVEVEEKVSESAKRRMAHLVKLSEKVEVEGVNARRFMMKQMMSKVT